MIVLFAFLFRRWQELLCCPFSRRSCCCVQSTVQQFRFFNALRRSEIGFGALHTIFRKKERSKDVWCRYKRFNGKSNWLGDLTHIHVTWNLSHDRVFKGSSHLAILYCILRDCLVIRNRTSCSFLVIAESTYRTLKSGWFSSSACHYDIWNWFARY
jgi:hypothetical protein